MSTEENKTLVRDMLEQILNRGNVGRVGDYFSGEFVNFGTRVGPGQFADVITRWRAAFPDVHATIDHLVAEDDLVVSDLTVRGTQHGPFTTLQWGTLPPTGRAYAVKHCHWWRIVEGKIAEHWALRDDLGQLRQLGHLVPPAPRGASILDNRLRRQRNTPPPNRLLQRVM